MKFKETGLKLHSTIYSAEKTAECKDTEPIFTAEDKRFDILRTGINITRAVKLFKECVII